MSIKNFLGNPTYSIIFLLTIFMFFSFKGCTKDSKNPIIEDEEDQTTVFFKGSDSEDIITIETSTGGELSVIGNNILISVDHESVDTDEIRAIIEETGGELVGQFPAIGMYQAEYPFSTGTELMSMINNLNNYSEIEFATYNALGSLLNTQHSKDYCNRNYDNHELNKAKDRFFDEMEYYSAVPIMGFVREHMTLSKVKVLVHDSMIAEEITKEFDDVKWIELTSSADENKYTSAHGTMVAGTIAADNKDGGVNGIASSLINDKLELISAARDTAANGRSVTGNINLLKKAIDREHPQIYNMSFGWGGLDSNGKEIDVEGSNKFFKKIFEHYSEVLFVAAAHNQYFEITNINFAPGGIQLPNVITVACTKYGNPQQAASWSAYGPLIDIAAPAEYCPVVHPTQANAVKIVSGNSIGAPAVASLAAILKSINPNLSPGLLKQYIIDYSWSTAQSVSGRRLVLTLPIIQVLIDMPAPDEILEKIDVSEPLGEWDIPGVVVSRICGRTTIEIDGEPIMQCETDSTNLGFLNEMGGGFVFNTKPQIVYVTFWHTYEILNSALEIVNEANITGTVSVAYFDSTTFTVGNSLSGEFSIQNAYITQRDPLNGSPWVINVEGKMSGIMEMMYAGDINIYYRDFSGIINTFIILYPGSSDEFDKYFEDNCD